LEFEAGKYGRISYTFRRELLLPSSGLKIKPDKQKAELCSVLTGCLAYFSNLKTEAEYSSETSVMFIVHLILFRSFGSLSGDTEDECLNL
jgi:hypothetical protein